MKKLVILLLVAFQCASAFAADNAKRFTKIIEKTDISDDTRLVELGDNARFWTTLLNTDKKLTKFNRNLANGNGAEKKAAESTAALPRFFPQFDEAVVTGLQHYCDSLVHDMALDATDVNFSFHIVNSPICDVFTARTDTGFAICLTSALLGRKGMTDDIVKGYVAREFVHGALRHHERSYYDLARKQRGEKIAIGLLSAAAIAAAVAIDVDTDYYYTRGDFQRSMIIHELRKLNRDKQIPLNRYAFVYNTDYEYEADLAAYRFMSYIGQGESYVDGLRILGTDYDTLYESFTDKPKIPVRIDFVEFVMQNPYLGRK